MSKIIAFIIVVLLTIILAGCGHNIHVQGFGFACPYGAMGYGTFSCVKDNVSVETSENTTKDGVETTNKFTVGKQTTGYDVEIEEVKAGK
jgi:hypothetical protein